MRAIFVSALLVFFAGQMLAQQFPSQIWHKGFVVSQEGDTISGKVKYDMETNSVQVNMEFQMVSLSSHNTLYFKIYDKTVGNYREFYSIPYEIKPQYRTRIFFELLYEGPLTLLSREEITQETVPSTSIYGSSYVREKLTHNFYFLDNKGNIAYFSGKKNDLFMIMAKKERKIKDFMKNNRLKSDEVRDLIRVTAFYNSI